MATERWPARMPVGMRDSCGVPVTSMWCFSPADPWAVTVRFLYDEDDAVEWTFARHLLAVGLHMPAGLADVQLWPDRGLVALRLSAPEGEETVTARAADLEEFLALTYGWVPAGDEASYVDVDAAVARVLEEADRC